MKTAGKITIGIIIILVGLAAMPALAAKAADWSGAKQEFQDNSKSNNDKKRAACTARLAENISPKTEVEAAKLLLEHLAAEVARNNEGKAEERVSIGVIDACVNGLKKISADKAVEIILKRAVDAKANWRARFYTIRAMAGISSTAVTPVLTGLLNDKEAALQMVALESLAELGWPDGIEPACNLLAADSPWEVKSAAVNYLRRIKSPDSIKPIQKAILRNKNMEARILSGLLELLKELPQPEDASPDSQADTAALTKSVVDLGEYYKVKINSDRIIFVIDVSGSMAWESREEPDKPANKETETGKSKEVTTGEGKEAPAPKTEPQAAPVPEEILKKVKEVENRVAKTRSDAVKKESIRAIYRLDPRVHFSIIFYSGGVQVWKNELVPATNEIKMEAINMIDTKGPGGGTNVYDALETAYRMVKSAANAPAKTKNEPKKVATGDKKRQVTIERVVSGADTIFLLTDGQPTAGKIQQPDEIINNIRKLNDVRHIKVNTIAVGASDPDNENSTISTLANVYLMRRLAEVTGGTFVNKTYRATEKDKEDK